MQGDELDHEILIKRGAGGELDLRDVTILNHEDDTHCTPRYTGMIPQTPTQYQSIPVETMMSGDILDNVPEKKIVRSHCFGREYIVVSTSSQSIQCSRNKK